MRETRKSLDPFRGMYPGSEITRPPLLVHWPKKNTKITAMLCGFFHHIISILWLTPSEVPKNTRWFPACFPRSKSAKRRVRQWNRSRTWCKRQDRFQCHKGRPKVESCRTWWNPLGFKHYCLEVPKGKIWFNWMDLTQHLCQNASTTENCLPFPLVNKPPFVCSFLCETNSSTHLIHQIELTWPTFTELVVSTPSKNMSRIGNHFPK